MLSGRIADMVQFIEELESLEYFSVVLIAPCAESVGFCVKSKISSEYK